MFEHFGLRKKIQPFHAYPSIWTFGGFRTAYLSQNVENPKTLKRAFTDIEDPEEIFTTPVST